VTRGTAIEKTSSDARRQDVVVQGSWSNRKKPAFHSGEQRCSLPPRSLSPETNVKPQGAEQKLARHSRSRRPHDTVQYALKGGEIYVLEVIREPRPVTFVQRVDRKPIAAIEARIHGRRSLASFDIKLEKLDHVGVRKHGYNVSKLQRVTRCWAVNELGTGER